MILGSFSDPSRGLRGSEGVFLDPSGSTYGLAYQPRGLVQVFDLRFRPQDEGRRTPGPEASLALDLAKVRRDLEQPVRGPKGP